MADSRVQQAEEEEEEAFVYFKWLYSWYALIVVICGDFNSSSVEKLKINLLLKFWYYVIRSHVDENVNELIIKQNSIYKMLNEFI